jgi:hypothetical protein
MSQKVEILRKADILYKNHNQITGFHFLDPSIDTEKIRFVATIRRKARNTGVITDFEGMCFSIIQYYSEKLGANSFKIKNYSYSDSSKYVSLTLDTYFSSDSMLLYNNTKKPTNVLYIFPEYQYSKNDNTFKFNRQKIKLSEREYFKYCINNTEKICISRGGWVERYKKFIEREPDQHSIYLRYSDGTRFPFYSIGKFSNIEEDFGELLINTLFKTPITLNNSQ